MASQETIDELLDQILQLKSDKLRLTLQLQEVLEHSGRCIALATELNDKLRSVEAMAGIACITGAPGARVLGQRIVDVIQAPGNP